MPFLFPTVPSATLFSAPPAKTASVYSSKAEALLLANENAMLALTSYSARCDIVYQFPPTEVRSAGRRDEESTLTAAKPNLMRYDHWVFKEDDQDSTAKPVKKLLYVYTSDGKHRVHQSDGTYRTDDKVRPEDMATVEEPWTGFYSKTKSQADMVARYRKGKILRFLRYQGKKDVEGVACDVVVYQYAFKSGKELIAHDCTLYFGPDKLLRRKTESLRFGDKLGLTREDTLRDIRTNFATPPRATFTYIVTPDSTPYDPTTAARPKLLAAGTPAPDFTIEDFNGKPVKLSDFRGKTVVLDFWATWCAPCIATMPTTNAAGKRFKDENVVVLAVNVWDEKEPYRKWVAKYQARYDSLQFLFDPHGSNGDIAKTKYSVWGIPTQYIIDPNGIIRTSFVGNDDVAVLVEAIRASQHPLSSSGGPGDK